LDGYKDVLNKTNTVSGWAYDPDAPKGGVNIRLYVGAVPTNTTPVVTAQTSMYRADVNAAFAISGNHGFSVTLPDSLGTDVAQDIYAYAVDTDGTIKPLGTMPQKFQFKLIEFKGNVDPVQQGNRLVGWAANLRSPASPVKVDFYINGPKSQGTYVGSATTSVYREDVSRALGKTGNFGFIFKMPLSVKLGNLTVYAYVSGENTHLPGTPFNFTMYSEHVIAMPVPFRVIYTLKDAYNYSYAPSIFKLDNTWHMYYCSNGTGPLDWDNIRYTTATNTMNWSKPTTVLRTSGGESERAVCDPSVVYYSVNGTGHYYMFYTGNRKEVQGLNFVARASNPQGPFYKLTKRLTWEINPSDPKPILEPLKAVKDVDQWYGLGQPTVVARGNTLYQWYIDSTADYPTYQLQNIYLSTSTNAINWSPRSKTNVVGSSIDIKYDPSSSLFVMYEMQDEHSQNSHVVRRTSKDGITWSNSTTIIPQYAVPQWSHNIGVGGTRTGDLIKENNFVAYGAPFDLVKNPSWGYWDLYMQKINTAQISKSENSNNNAELLDSQKQPTDSFFAWKKKMLANSLSTIMSEAPTPPVLPQTMDSESSCPSIIRTLSKGSHGDDVVSLQRYLIKLGLLADDMATGYFGNVTEGAVQKFQQQKQIVTSGTPNATGFGVVGPVTRNTIQSCK
jgi:hypothetical protein